ncbi:MAG: type II and III secretion system protein, partial [Pseudomonadota bacterium]
KVISSPTLMVMDNKEATLQIGDEVPVATTSAVSTIDPDAAVVSEIEYRDTGIILDVKPQIGRDGRVVLDITQEVSSVVSTNTSGIDSPTIRQRQISTNVALRDGLTLALGGLVREADNVTETKVPGLGDVPVLGAAFRSRSLSKERSELLILIRPRIVESDDEAQQITEYWRSKISQANTILQSGLGSPRHQLRNVIE